MVRVDLHHIMEDPGVDVQRQRYTGQGHVWERITVTDGRTRIQIAVDVGALQWLADLPVDDVDV